MLDTRLDNWLQVINIRFHFLPLTGIKLLVGIILFRRLEIPNFFSNQTIESYGDQIKGTQGGIV